MRFSILLMAMTQQADIKKLGPSCLGHKVVLGNRVTLYTSRWWWLVVRVTRVVVRRPALNGQEMAEGRDRSGCEIGRIEVGSRKDED